MQITATIASGPQSGQTFTMLQPIYVGANNGDNFADSLDNYPGHPMQLIGQTAIHPVNHWCRPDFCTRLLTLATEYRNGSGLTIAYNDGALVKGGVFDLNQNFQGPHQRHRGGLDQDVRANGGPNSIPFDPATRSWFEALVQIYVGPQPPWWHEEIGTGNEHYHIVG